MLFAALCPDAIIPRYKASPRNLRSGLDKLLDAIVVGAGPAGNQTALKLARAGHEVVVLDYRTRLGDKPCTGIIGRECFEAFSVPQDMVLNEARSARFMTGASGDILIARPNPQAYVIDRARFVSHIADTAAAEGATYINESVVTNVNVTEDYVEVRSRSNGELRRHRARTIVVASGAGSRLAEMAGLSPARSLAYASQAVVETRLDSEVTVVLPGAVPAGHFGWIVPQGNGKALLGVLGRPRHREAGEQVLRAARTAGVAGWRSSEWRHWPVPVGTAPITASHRALLVGDAAGQVKPTTGGGIYYSLIAADLAAETLDRSLKTDDLGAEALSSYEVAWKSALGRELRVGRIARSIFERLDGRSIAAMLRAAEASGITDEDGSFDWHSDLIVRVLARRTLDTALKPIRAVSNALSALV